MNKHQSGFTLIELMVVIVIIGILVAVVLPNFLASADRAKVSSVKSNMHTFQVMLETYGVDWQGTYPHSMAELSTEATTNRYAKSYTNPFSGVVLTIANTTACQGLAEVVSGAGAPSSWTSPVFYSGSGGSACYGQVIYRRSVRNENYNRYTIYGLNKAGAFIDLKGKIMVLTNG